MEMDNQTLEPKSHLPSFPMLVLAKKIPYRSVEHSRSRVSKSKTCTEQGRNICYFGLAQYRYFDEVQYKNGIKFFWGAITIFLNLNWAKDKFFG